MLLTALFFALFYAVYGLAAVLGDGLTGRHRLYFAWEPGIPLLPWTAAVYLSLDLMVVPLLLTFPTPLRLLPVLLTLSAELLVATGVFLLYPLEAGFHDSAPTGVLALAQAAALRHNYMPSLHVALAFTAAATIGQQLPRTRSRGLYLWASLIALSTLTTHSHHVVDILAGMALAAAAVATVYLPLQRRWA